jgi:DNA repair protein RadD
LWTRRTTCAPKLYQKILALYPHAIVIGLTATPCRGDGSGLGNVFEVMVEGPSVPELIELKCLVQTKIYAPSTPDLEGVKVKLGDYVENELAGRMNTDKLVGDVVEQWFKHGERRPTVVFATGVQHSVHIRDEFRRAGVLAEHIDGTTPIEERDRILALLASGKVELVTNAMVLTEGWDCPSVSCLVLARPTKSLGLYRQMVGRVLRPAPGKSDALILDHAGAVFEHRLPEDPVEWSLGEDQRAVKQTARFPHRAAQEPPAFLPRMQRRYDVRPALRFLRMASPAQSRGDRGCRRSARSPRP